jgi:hypothetical protein
VVGDRAHIVEELGVYRPPLVFVPDPIADELAPERVDRVTKRKPLALMDHITQTFVVLTIIVSRFGRRSKPSFIDPASVLSEGIIVIRMEFDASSRLQK